MLPVLFFRIRWHCTFLLNKQSVFPTALIDQNVTEIYIFLKIHSASLLIACHIYTVNPR